MFLAEGRENVDFDESDESLKLSDEFKKTLRNFQDENVKDSFLNAVLLGILTKSSNNKNVTIKSTNDVLGEEFSLKLLSEKENLQHNDSFESFFDQCHLMNDLLKEKRVSFESLRET